MFIKRILQRELPEQVRRRIVDTLFAKYVATDEDSFAHELYMSLDQMKCMRRHGMYMGSHGFDHCWLNTLDAAAQENEIDRSLQFLKEVGCKTTRWVLSYPYGGVNDSLLRIVQARGCVLGVGTQAGIADLSTDYVLILPRLDTNDLPRDGDAVANSWTLAMQGHGGMR